jgi:hypothetical protein
MASALKLAATCDEEERGEKKKTTVFSIFVTDVFTLIPFY